jgi:SAM-dependent methyltransferase
MNGMIGSMDLRTTFDEDAERYDRFRPTYPPELFKKLIDDAGIDAGSFLLEIGLGTGQATRPIADTGADITAIELGSELAEKARHELRRYANVAIITDSFENADLPAAHYDCIYAATAFHWVKDEYKFTKTAKLLKPGGYLALIHTEHISDDKGDVFGMLCQPIYDTYWPPQQGTTPPRLPRIRSLQAPFIDTRLFEVLSFTVFREVKMYTAHDYAGLLSTFSPTIALPAARRRRFLADIENVINEQCAGRLEKHFAFTLTIVRKK